MVPAVELVASEPQGDLSLSTLHRITAMDDISATHKPHSISSRRVTPLLQVVYPALKAYHAFRISHQGNVLSKVVNQPTYIINVIGLSYNSQIPKQLDVLPSPFYTVVSSDGARKADGRVHLPQHSKTSFYHIHTLPHLRTHTHYTLAHITHWHTLHTVQNTMSST